VQRRATPYAETSGAAALTLISEVDLFDVGKLNFLESSVSVSTIRAVLFGWSPSSTP
jgi:hypothetical protein